MTAAAGLTLDRRRALVAIIDLQDRLAAAMAPDELAAVIKNTCVLIETARRLALPVVLSEQYPRGLGSTVAPIAEALAGLDPLARIEKLEFGLCEAGGFAALDADLAGRDQWLVAGMESHICVYQTARGLVARGKAVHVVTDAVISRSAPNRQIGLDLMARAGAIATSTEAAVFDLLAVAGTEDFKALSRLIR